MVHSYRVHSTLSITCSVPIFAQIYIQISFFFFILLKDSKSHFTLELFLCINFYFFVYFIHFFFGGGGGAGRPPSPSDLGSEWADRSKNVSAPQQSHLEMDCGINTLKLLYLICYMMIYANKMLKYCFSK